MNKQKNKGITLIALVITIIVLLILAGVTISMLFGENGIINQANIASEETIKAKEIEQIKLAYTAAKSNKMQNGDSSFVISTELNDEFAYNNTQADAEMEIDTDSEEPEVVTDNIIVVFRDTDNKYQIDKDGKITYIGKASDEEQEEEEQVEYIVGYGNEWLFDTNDNCIYQYTGNFSNLENNTLVIPTYWKESPSSTDEYEVKGIKKNNSGNILSGNTAIAPENLKLKIPFGIEKICGNSFAGCSQFTGDLVIPNSVTNIDGFAFENCTGFNGSLIIGDCVETISGFAFKGCTEFTGDLVLGKSLKTLSYPFYSAGGKFTGKLVLKAEAMTWDIDGIKTSAFSRLIIEKTVKEIKNSTFSGFSNMEGTLTIPNSVTSIGKSAFANCSKLTGDLKIPNSVTTLGVYAFENCSGLDGDLIIGDGVETIGGWAFKGCSGFTGDVVIGKNVQSLEGYLFLGGCNNCTGKLIIKADTLKWNNDGIKNSAFSQLIIEGHPTEIPAGTFSGFSNLEGTLTIPDTVTSIGKSAFANCPKLTGDLIIPDSVKTIYSYAFDRCSGFTGDLVIGDGVEKIEGYAFIGATGFTGDFTIGKSITSLDKYTFYSSCNHFAGKFIVRTENVPGLPTEGLSSSSFSELVIDDTVKKIGDNAFKGFKNIQGKLTIPNTVESIGSDAFYNCNSITAIEVDKAPDGISGSPWGWTKGTVRWLRTQ